MKKTKGATRLVLILSLLIIIRLMPRLYLKIHQEKSQMEEDLSRLEAYTNLKYEKRANLEILEAELKEKILRSNYEDFLRRLYTMEGLDIKILDLSQTSKTLVSEDGLDKIQRKLNLSLDLVDSQDLETIQGALNTSDFIEIVDLKYRRDEYGHRLDLRLLVDEYRIDSYDE